MRTVAGLALALTTASWMAGSVAGAQSANAGPGGTPLVATNDAIRASLARIAAHSPSWRAAVEALRPTGRHVVIVTPDQLPGFSADGTSKRPFERAPLAEANPIPGRGDLVDAFMVVINVPLVEALHRDRDSLPAEMEADLDVLVVHEVYGHALPYLLAGDESGRCPDPAAGQRASEACSIRRENVVRAELGLGRRTDYGVTSLLFARR